MNTIKSVFVEKLIGTATAGDHEFACYGEVDLDGAIIVQVGLVGVNVDLFEVMDKAAITGIEGQIYDAYLNDVNQSDYDRKFFAAM